MKKFPKQILCLLLPVVLFSCGKSDSPKKTEEISLRQYAGTNIVVLADKHPWVDLVKTRVIRFTAATGIGVTLKVYPEDQFRIKRIVEMLSGVSDVDLFMLMPGNSLDKYVKEGWVDGLTPYLNNPRYAWPDYEYEDIFNTALKAGIRKGESYTLPIMLETSLIAYNKKIFEDMKLKIPETMEELEETSRQIYEESGHTVYGITMRGKRGAATSQWIDFVHSFGGDWLDINGRAALNSEEALNASRYYGRLLRLYGPPSAPSNGWYESTSLFMQGKAAMIYDANVFNSNYENRHISKVAGHVGYAVIPSGPAGAVPHVSSWGLSLYKYSKKKGAALYFMQWATGKENALIGLQQGIPAARKSAWEYFSRKTENNSDEWINASLTSFEKATTNWNPPVVDVDSGRELVSSIVTAAILDQNLVQTAGLTTKLLNDLMDEEKEPQK